MGVPASAPTQESNMNNQGILIVIAAAAGMATLINVKNEQTNNFLRNPAQSITRKTVAPQYLDYITRKVAKLNRPTGGEKYFKPVRIIYVDKAELENPCLAGNCHGEVSPVYSSSLDSLIIKDGMK